MKDLPTLPHSERLIVVVGPSGAGKDSVLQAWAGLRSASGPQVHQAQRVITRPADGGAEQHEAVSAEDFVALQTTGVLATTWQAHGLSYGVRHHALAPLAAGDWVVLNSSRAHLPTLRQQAPGLSVVEITAPPAMRAQRLLGRGREDEAAVSARLQRHTPTVQADLTLVNDSSLHEVAQALQRWWTARQAVP
ncbi:MAG: phosphonate metabolism protein/1,5-bisphosphokinase (PRPP-forming) PhnN [Rhizobacter sp.]|nr:phosphonate metabolism protein/1,5-bisphosphokinase (PRPP-forming) PhnN [Rhizobacter sp.]